jgi:hypothetical protein
MRTATSSSRPPTAATGPTAGDGWKVAGEQRTEVSRLERYPICAGSMVNLYGLPQSLEPPKA